MAADDDRTALGLGRRIRTALTLAWRATGRGVIEFYNSENLTFSSSIAYFALLSIFPFILIVLTILSQAGVLQAGNERAVSAVIERALPSNFDFLGAQIVQLQRAPVELTIVGTIITLWASMGVFGALTSAVDHAWGTDRPYTFWKHKLVAFVMMLTAFVLFAAVVFFSGAGHLADARGIRTVQRWFPWFTDVTKLIASYSLLPGSIVALGLIYYYAPNTRVRLRDVWFGAVLAAVLWRLALAGFSWYLRSFSQFTVHGSIGAVVAFLVWVYLSAVILLYGVEVTASYARLRLELRGEQRALAESRYE